MYGPQLRACIHQVSSQFQQANEISTFSKIVWTETNFHQWWLPHCIQPFFIRERFGSYRWRECMSFFFLFAFLRAHFFGSRFIRAFSMWRFFCINWLLYHIVCYHFNVRVFLSLRSRFQFTKQNLSPSFLSMISAPFFLARLGVDVYLFVCSFSRSCRFGWRCIYFILCCLSSVSENFILVWTVSTSQKAI